MTKNSICLLFAVGLIGAGPPFSGSPPKGETAGETKPETKTETPAETKPEGGGEKKGPPFSDGPKTEGGSGAKPAERTWTVKAGEFAFTVGMKPGIPDPDTVTEIMIAANSVPKTPHPRFGNRVPIENASLTVEVSSPGGELVARFLAHPIPLSSGKYGLHFTPAQEGIYTLSIKGSTAEGKALVADIKLPVKVWPLPAELQGSGDEADKSGGRKPIKM